MSMVLLSDPEIAAVPVDDDGEPLVDLEGLMPVDATVADDNPWRGWVRAGLADRLVTAQRALPDDLKLLVAEGYRPLPLQEQHFARYCSELRRLRPDWTPALLHREASRFISPPDVAPHCTGGAVDLTLCTAGGRALDLGTAINDSPVASANRCYTEAPDIPPEARHNRVVLATVLLAAGLVNYPTEWWHWSFGERYWAHARRTRACYGPVGAPRGAR